jgi:hypothetical protein
VSDSLNFFFCCSIRPSITLRIPESAQLSRDFSSAAMSALIRAISAGESMAQVYATAHKNAPVRFLARNYRPLLPRSLRSRSIKYGPSGVRQQTASTLLPSYYCFSPEGTHNHVRYCTSPAMFDLQLSGRAYKCPGRRKWKSCPRRMLPQQNQAHGLAWPPFGTLCSTCRSLKREWGAKRLAA